MQAIQELMGKVAEAKKFPKLVFDLGKGRKIVFHYIQSGKWTGSIRLTTGRYTDTLLGFVTPRGYITKVTERWVSSVLNRIGEDPLKFMADYGIWSGRCCICNRELTDTRSIELGIGPVCRKHIGLH